MILAHRETLRPIRIEAGALGAGLPTHDLLVSPQHRVLVQSRVAERMFGTPQVLVAAKQLCSVAGISRVDNAMDVTYVHIMFDRHQIVYSNGAPTEAFLPGTAALRTIEDEARAEIMELFPELRSRGVMPTPARHLVTGRLGRKLADRHATNGKPLLDTDFHG